MTPRIETIRANRAKHLEKLRGFWLASLKRWLGSSAFANRRHKRDRGKYNPCKEDRKHDEHRNNRSASRAA